MSTHLSYYDLPPLVDCHTPRPLHSTDSLDWSAKLIDWQLHSDREWTSFDVLPLHFDVQLVPPSTGGLVADFKLAGFSLLHRAVYLLTSDL